MKTQTPAPDVVRHLLLAALATVALYFVPFAGLITYPVRLLVTFIHEGGHALAALLTGGWVHGMGISPDGSGVTWTSGGIGLIVSSAGYLGATLYGALLLALLRRGVSGRVLLAVTGGAVALMSVACLAGIATGAKDAFYGLIWGIALSLVLLAGAARLPMRWADLTVGFLGVQCVLNALFDLRTLFQLSVATGAATDAMNLQRATLIPAPVWASLWIASAVAILWAVLVRPALRGR
jgi:hypothetical protein